MPLDEWIKLALEFDKIKLIPLTPEISIQSVKFGREFHGDPADRIIAATSVLTKSQLITKDEKLRKNKSIVTNW